MFEGKIALFGGTFDPVHYGHLEIARIAQKELKLKEVIFIPNKKSPLKNHSPLVEPGDRLKMVELALKDDPLFSVSDYEINKFGIDYSYLTANHFKKKFPQSKLYWLLGADQVEQLHLWVKIKKMSLIVDFVSGERNGIRKLNKYLAINIKFLNFDSIDISSTVIRKNIHKQEFLRSQIPYSVLKYILANRLYV